MINLNLKKNIQSKKVDIKEENWVLYNSKIIDENNEVVFEEIYFRQILILKELITFFQTYHL